MYENKKIIAAIKGIDEFEQVLKTDVDCIFFLSADISDLSYAASSAKLAKKELYIHIDLTSGLGKDRSGIEYAKSLGINGIVSTRANIIKMASELGLNTVQRFFAVDTQSVKNILSGVVKLRPDYIEIMPGIAFKIIKDLSESIDIPIIAGGLIESEAEVLKALEMGAFAVSTGSKALWNSNL